MMRLYIEIIMALTACMTQCLLVSLPYVNSGICTISIMHFRNRHSPKDSAHLRRMQGRWYDMSLQC
jgi:hypothetical protein